MKRVTKLKMTKAQRRMLEVHASVYPRAVAHTSELGRLATWRSLYEAGWVKGGVVTDAGHAALRAAGQRHNEGGG